MVPRLGKEESAVNGEEALVGGFGGDWGPTRSLSWAAAASAVNPRLNSIPGNLTTAGRRASIDQLVECWFLVVICVDSCHWSQVAVR